MNIFESWQFYAACAGYMVFMAAVGALEIPTKESAALYRWLYRFLNALAVNMKDVAGGRMLRRTDHFAVQPLPPVEAERNKQEER